MNNNIQIKLDDKNYKIQLPENDQSMVIPDSKWEEWQYWLYSQILKKDSYCLDIGSHVGINSLYMAHLCPDGFIYAFEPNPNSEKLSLINFKNNEVDNIKVFASSLSDTIATQKLKINQQRTGDTYITQSEHYDILNNSTTLDTWYKMHNYPFTLIKIDVEGFEYKVLKGATYFLSNNPQIKAIIEFCPLHIARSNSYLHQEAYNFYLYLIEKFNYIFIINRECSLTRVRNYAQLLLSCEISHGLVDLFCCNSIPKILLNSIIPKQKFQFLPIQLEIQSETECMINILNRYEDKWAKLTHSINNTGSFSGAIITSRKPENKAIIVLQQVYKEHSQQEEILVQLTHNNSTQILNIIGDTDTFVTLSLFEGTNYITLNCYTTFSASNYFNNPLDKRQISFNWDIVI